MLSKQGDFCTSDDEPDGDGKVLIASVSSEGPAFGPTEME